MRYGRAELAMNRKHNKLTFDQCRIGFLRPLVILIGDNSISSFSGVVMSACGHGPYGGIGW
jgi:hypothetical protein